MSEWLDDYLPPKGFKGIRDYRQFMIRKDSSTDDVICRVRECAHADGGWRGFEEKTHFTKVFEKKPPTV